MLEEEGEEILGFCAHEIEQELVCQGELNWRGSGYDANRSVF
jgi:hypothetical protein